MALHVYNKNISTNTAQGKAICFILVIQFELSNKNEMIYVKAL